MIRFKNYRPGPAMLVSAAFIGPGTVTAASVAGANFGYALLWALAFATIATIILQSMAVKVAVVTQQGLAETLMASFTTPLVKIAVAALVFVALAVGNAAYEAGNIGGASLGVAAIIGSENGAGNTIAINLVIGVLAAMLIVLGKPKWLETLLIGLVIAMSLAFIAAFFLTKPNFSALLAGFVPSVPTDGLLVAIALIGTTIVPYNLFLHAAMAREHWKTPETLPDANADTVISIGIGGLVSMAILATAASSLFESQLEITNAADMARQIEPIFGEGARYALGFGLFAAGLTSAITAPLATGYILVELLKGRTSWSEANIRKLTAFCIILIGTAVVCLGIKPVEIILFAQVANGLLLPIIAIFLLKIANDKMLLGEHVNGIRSNMLGFLIVGITLLLGYRLIARAIGIWP